MKLFRKLKYCNDKYNIISDNKRRMIFSTLAVIAIGVAIYVGISDKWIHSVSHFCFAALFVLLGRR